MSAIFSGKCWISDAAELPALDDDRFGAGWTHIGEIHKDEHDLWDQIRKPSRRRTAEFYVSIFQDNLQQLPPRFWLGVEWLTEQLYVGTGPAAPQKLRRRVPETHPGLVDRPFRYLSARVTAGKDCPLFERLR